MRKSGDTPLAGPARPGPAPPPVPPPCPLARPGWDVPGDEECLGFWDRHAMPEHIRRHSLLVAQVATFLAAGAEQAGLGVSVQTVRASALLHDLAKAYTIDHGGSHSQLGASWTVGLTRNPALAQGVMHHVYWPYEVDIRKYFLPLAVIYGDKRVRHDDLVPLDRRFEDLVDRYGKTCDIRRRIGMAHAQATELERLFTRLIEVDIHACSFDCRGLVRGA